MKFLLSIIFLSLFIQCSVGQGGAWSTKSKKAIKYIEQSREALNELDPNTGYPDYKRAIELCNKAIDKDPNFIEAYLMKSDYATSIGDYETAIESLNKTIQINPNYSRTGYVYADLANLEWKTAKYKDALVHAKHYKTIPGANKDVFKKIDWLILNCEFAVNAIKNPLPFDPVNLGPGVNTDMPEYFPTLTVDQEKLLFTREVGKISYTRRGQEDFFISDLSNGDWQTGRPMPPNINTSSNEGAPTFAPDGRTLIFVGCVDERGQYGNNRRGYGSCDLFVTKKVGNKWLNPRNLPGEVNSQHWETQPSLSADGKTLFFIRGSRKKRQGDIYMAKLQPDGSWGEVTRLPNNINTPFAEKSVLIHPDGKTLYFASNGHVGMGGFDLYMTQLQPDGSWSDPKNLGYPINTEKNESSLLVYANGEYAIFGSDRAGGFGYTDLYQFKMPKSIQPTKTIYMTGLVYNKKTNQPLEAQFTLIDLGTGKEVIVSKSDKINGKFLVTLPINREYALLVNNDGYQPYSINFNFKVDLDNPKPFHQNVPLIPINNMDEEIVLENVFFDVDSYKIRPKSFVELDLLVAHLNKHKTMKIELQGHTDSKGEDAQNLELSANRADAVKKYLVSKGIDETRLTSKGFGESAPSSITLEDGTEQKLTEEYINGLPKEEQKSANQANRRTIYKVISL